jgi:photosystem II stability/assembly factor-like uncharacterized protein
MKRIFFSLVALCVSAATLSAQHGWSVCNAPAFTNRIDDVFMVDAQTGYAVSGDGKIVKTTDSGDSWTLISHDDSIYCRSVEFVTPLKGFVGGFPNWPAPTQNVFRRTTDGGATWTDLTPLLDPYAQVGGICGLCAPDSNTIYGCGNWYNDTAYIVKSVDGGNTWSYIDMHQYATSLIDMHFISKDTGFATGTGLPPLQTPVILYTTDGGASWTYKYQNGVVTGYCWKIQRLSSQEYFASIQDFGPASPTVLKSTDGGMSWTELIVQQAGANIEGIGFINSQKGWTGGDPWYSFESNDGGITWDTVHIIQLFNRFFKINDSLAFATGGKIWKYNPTMTAVASTPDAPPGYSTLSCTPNPASDVFAINWSIAQPTRVVIGIYGQDGQLIMTVENANRMKGAYQEQVSTANLPSGIYYVVLQTHEDLQTVKIVIAH